MSKECLRNSSLLTLIGIVCSFNLSPVPNVVLRMPNSPTPQPKVRSSYFGYTIVLREHSVIISAPRAQSTLESQARINETGALFKCPLSFREDPQSMLNITCLPFAVDTDGNLEGRHYLEYEVKDHQWLGASMDGGPKESDPLLVCAPHFAGGFDGESKEQYFHGICYWTPNTEGEAPSKGDVKKIKPLTNSAKQTYKINGATFWNYQLGEQGFSAHITRNNMDILMGAPGIDLWKGSVVHYNIFTGKAKIPHRVFSSFSYGGYAVSSGYLDSENRDKIINVLTSPHSSKSQLGEAILFDFEAQGAAIEKKAILRGTKYGEFFGYAVLVEDINNDDMEDVIVSAPLYSLDDSVDAGAVYVFINTGSFFFQQERIDSPFKKQGRFGTTLAKLGDLNHDGYQDVAIGAPFLDGHGAVAIYLGGPDGLQESPCQVLGVEPPILEAFMFGHGLSNGVDMDGNGFNDLAIGAPESETVYIYRAYPVVDVTTRITPSKAFLELNESKLEIEFCFKMDTKSKIMEFLELNLEVELDAKLRRISFEDSGDYRVALRMNASRDEDCQAFMGVAKFLDVFAFTPMELSLKYSLVHDAAEQRGKREFCSKCAVLRPTSRRIARSSVTYRLGCKEAICKVDLRIKALQIPSNFTLGESNVFYALYLIENLGEKAFDAKLEVSTSLNVSHARIPPNCMTDVDNGNKLICRLALGREFTGNTTLEIGFDLNHLTQISVMNISAMAYSAGDEIAPQDNVLNSTVEFFTMSSLEIIGQSNETFTSILDKSDSFNIFYTFKLQNNGPSVLRHFGLWLLAPATYRDAKNGSHSFLNLNTSKAFAVLKDLYLPADTFDTENSIAELNERAQKSIIQEEVLMQQQQILPINRTISINSNSSNARNLASALIRIQQLEVGQHLTLELVLNIAPKVIKDVLEKRFDYLELFMDMAIEALTPEHVKLNVTKVFAPKIVVNIAPPSTPVWIYIASIVGGLTLVMLMGWGLQKLGFFKRQTKQEMEKLINEKLEKARMKSELEAEISLEK